MGSLGFIMIPYIESRGNDTKIFINLLNLEFKMACILFINLWNLFFPASVSQDKIQDTQNMTG